MATRNGWAHFADDGQAKASVKAGRGKPKWLKIVLIVLAVLIVLGAIGNLMGTGDGAGTAATQQPSQSNPGQVATSTMAAVQTAQEAASTAGAAPVASAAAWQVYPDDAKIDAFLAAFNEAYPDQAIAPGAVEKSYHHGREHDDQVIVTIDGISATVSSEFKSGTTFGVSVYWDNPDLTSPDANTAMFSTVMHVLAPGITDDQISQRWQEVVANGTLSTTWDDGIEVWPGAKNPVGGPGTYEYMKIYG